ncbi:BrxA/BrxB family bacilliredoxin [Jeotgalibacillus proteolyticus]|uniref:BrxA/BrxB family bacilliredoxin n=1 Tax=Jeotgalibacillus proteolyticus TaxID=2082395 RepID=A0A2S5GE64_9BACL|nr:BrxA/BrxB family bacilliredoxin [Jeotgalibacillus proteolyticus]PPA71205.1 BrxA/BrxB family bacilliredoxin [Jeotgalibacillus proteolyticus]
MSMAYEEYMKQLVKPMRKELTQAGFKELTTEEEVLSFMDDITGTSLVVINSVCGCAAGLARPAVTNALITHEKEPDHLVTVFAGQDKEATQKMRSFMKDYEPSSPSIALFKNKEVVHFIPREEIEDHSVEDIVENIKGAMDKHC